MSPYMPAASLLTKIWSTKSSIKTLAYDIKGNLTIKKSAYAQVCHVLENQSLLVKLQRIVKIPCRNQALLLVLLYELLLGPSKKIRGGGTVKRQIMKKEVQLRSAMKEILKCYPSSGRVIFPKYVRVNTLKCSLNEAISKLKSQSGEVFYLDPHVQNLLVLNPNNNLHQNEFVLNGKFVLQDKSSCFSALCLIHGNSVPLEGDCLDACAAPGNKTSHLASLTNFKIFACERNEKRLDLLNRRMEILVTKDRVVTNHVDFLKTKPSDYSNVKGILLDPSCSGSGMYTALDRLADDNEHADDSDDRLEHLSNFQLTALLHAMSFESVDRIVYSTCSVHKEENELVVQQALQSTKQWNLRAPYCLRTWKRRGVKVAGLTNEQINCLIRANKDDDTNGFFVAYFERDKIASISIPSTSTNQGSDVISNELSFYNGEFSPKLKEHLGTSRQKVHDIPVLTLDSKKVKKPEEILKHSLVENSSQTEKAAIVEIESMEASQCSIKKNHGRDKITVSSKKQSKKKAWKLKQIDLKRKRLLKQKDFS
jgi:25S rRNA (cytosine2278-C5)-methyltransferase